MDECFDAIFPREVRRLRLAVPNPVVREHILHDPDAVFFGGRGWERCREDLAEVPPADRARFLLCLFGLVLLDQHLYTSFPSLHGLLRERCRVPKFGWSGFGAHNENPFLLLVVPVREGLVGTEDLAEVAPEAMKWLAEKAAGLLAGTGVTEAEFYRRLHEDPGFTEYAGDPGRDAVVGVLDAVLAARGVDWSA